MYALSRYTRPFYILVKTPPYDHFVSYVPFLNRSPCWLFLSPQITKLLPTAKVSCKTIGQICKFHYIIWLTEVTKNWMRCEFLIGIVCICGLKILTATHKHEAVTIYVRQTKNCYAEIFSLDWSSLLQWVLGLDPVKWSENEIWSHLI